MSGMRSRFNSEQRKWKINIEFPILQYMSAYKIQFFSTPCLFVSGLDDTLWVYFQLLFLQNWIWILHLIVESWKKWRRIMKRIESMLFVVFLHGWWVIYIQNVEVCVRNCCKLSLALTTIHGLEMGKKSASSFLLIGWFEVSQFIYFSHFLFSLQISQILQWFD